MKRLTAVIFAVAMAFMLCGCGGKNTDNTKSVSMPNLKSVALSDIDYDGDNTQLQIAAHGANDFAFDFTGKLLGDNGENFVCSPFSAWMPMAALANTVDEENREAYLKSLYAKGVSCDELNDTASSLLYDLTCAGENEWRKEDGDEPIEPLQIVNAVFVDNDSTLNMDFAQKFLDNYRGRAMSVDFASNEAVEEINKWASETTNGLIEDVLDELDPATVAAIANAIYYSDRWSWEFNENENLSFKAPDGDTDATFMVHNGRTHNYYEDDEMQVVKMNFVCGGSMYILLPKSETPEDLLRAMTSEKLSSINQNSEYDADGLLKLPKFKISGDTFDIKTALEQMGFPVFDENFGTITGLCDNCDPLYISNALQKAMIDVDEKGTTAAAVTVIECCETACAPEETKPHEMICDHPFAFVLTSNTYLGGETVLFTGVVNNPVA